MPEGVGPPIGWNFVSFLVTRGGEVHTRWDTGTSLTSPQNLAVVEALLAEKDEI